MIQLSYTYTTTGKTIALTIQTFVFFLKYLFIYYSAVLGLEHAGSSLLCSGFFLVGVHGLTTLSCIASWGLSFPVAFEILVPQPGIKPVSFALEGGFLTTGPPGNSRVCFLKPQSDPLSFLSKVLHWCLVALSNTIQTPHRDLQGSGVLAAASFCVSSRPFSPFPSG